VLFSLLSGLAQARDCGRDALGARSATHSPILQAARESLHRKKAIAETDGPR
jgi:hypothetical protein